MIAITVLAVTMAATAPVGAAASAQDATADAPPAQTFDYKRSGFQIGSAMALGVAWYQWQIELNERDFDFDRSWTDQWRRLSTGAGYRLDDNNPTLNVGHSFMGTVYHQFARANGGTMAQAMLFDFVTSSTWEFAVEHREVISVNDTIITSLGGVALGESLFQLGDFFARSEPTIANRVLMTLASPARAWSFWAGDRPGLREAYAPYGLAADAAHSFALSVGAAQPIALDRTDSAPAPWQAQLRLDLDLVNLPSYGHQAEVTRVMRGGEMTRIEVSRTGGSGDASHIELASRATLWGRYRQRATGSAIFLGSATALDVWRDQLGQSNDFVADMHLVGPALDATWFYDRVRIRTGADLYPDFAMVRPFALRDLPTGLAREGMKSTLVDSDYYYALGLTAAARFEAAIARASAGLDVAFLHLDSIEGLDRHQNAYTNPNGIYHAAVSHDDDLTDQRLRVRLHGESPLPSTNVRLGVSLDYQYRRGTARSSESNLESTGRDLRWGVNASYAL